MRFANGVSTILVLFLAATGVQAPAMAATFNVADVAGLRTALLAAGANGEDDVIVLAAGTYATDGTAFSFLTNESKSLTLRGANGTTRSQVVLDGGGTSRVLNFPCVGVCGALTLQGLTVQNSKVTAGGGVYAESQSLTLVDVSFAGNQVSTDGGAIFGNYVTVTDSSFSNNAAQGRGGAIYGFAATVINSSFSNNTASSGHGGALYASTGTVSNSSFSNNAASEGGAIYGGNITVAKSSFSGNTSTSEIGCSRPVHFDPVFSDPPEGGGAIHAGGGTVTNSSFINNKSGCMGGAIYVPIQKTIPRGETVTGSIFSNNTANGHGGAVYGATVANSIFNSNTAGGDGGAIYGYGQSVVNSIFNNNATTSSVWCTNPFGCTPTFVIGNGGAISATSINNSFSGNSTMGLGAAIYSDRSISIISSVFYGHTTPAVYGASTYNLYNNLIDSDTGFAGTPPVMAGNVAPGATSPFVDAANGNLQLVAGSTAIDAGLDPNSTTFANLVGSNFFVGSSVADLRKALLTDLAGNPRPTAGTPVDIGAYEFSGNPMPTVPKCALTAAPASITPGGTSSLTTSCRPAATTYSWTGGTCGGTSAASCTVTLSATTTFTVTGSNGGGTGNLASATVAVTPVIPASERQVLLEIYASTNGANWTRKGGWNGPVGTECSWTGIVCDNTLSHVTDIVLTDNNLVGSLPSLSGLTALQVLTAGGNQLTGSIPFLGGLTALRSLELRYSQLSGSIPSLSGLTALQRFFVPGNRLTGSIPSLSGLTALGSLDVSGNQLTGSIPSLSGLTALGSIRVNNNLLTGPVPAAATSLYSRGSDLCGNSLVSSGSPAIDAAWVTVTGTDWLACQSVAVPPTISGVSRNYGSATIAFTAPLQFTSYEVTCTAAGQTTRTGTGTSSPITVQGLTGGVTYSCALTAGAANAPSAPSVVVPVTTQSVVPMMNLLLFD